MPTSYFLISVLCVLYILGQPVEETPESMLFYSYHPNEPLSKERVEAFSDGVYAIVATLLILDIWSVQQARVCPVLHHVALF